VQMVYEQFKKEVERILEDKARPVTWNEIRDSSTRLKQKVPYHVYVQKLQGEIGLVRFKHKDEKRVVWALRRWFEDGKFSELLPDKMKLTILSVKNDRAIAVDEFWELKRVYPLKIGLQSWDAVSAEIEEFFPEEDRRPGSIRLKRDGIEYLQSIDTDEERIRIAERTAESGEFLHTGAWKGKTLGLTKPRFRCFYFYDTRCQFFCDQSVCVGHDMAVEDGSKSIEIRGDRVYFVLEPVEQEHGEYIWEKSRVEWRVTSAISLTDPLQRRLL